MKKAFILTCLSLWVLSAIGQTQADYGQKYLNAKTLYKEGRFGLAKSLFEELRIQHPENPFFQYSTYYSALCSYQEGYPSLAKRTFLDILRRYPDWSQNNEVRYWLVVIFFETHEPYYAFETLESIEDEEISLLLYDIQRFHLAEVQSVDSLQNLNNIFSDNQAIAEALATAILAQPFNQRDYSLLNDLGRQFPTVADQITKESIIQEQKDEYKVSLLFPFLANRLTPDTSPKFNEFVLELYRGIRLAADSLNTDSTWLELQLFDTKRDTTQVKKLFSDPKLADSDLIIGPLYNSQLIHPFSQENKINVLNPFTQNESLIAGNPFYYLHSQLPRNVGFSAAQYIKSKDTFKKGLVIYSYDPLDTTVISSLIDSVGTHPVELEMMQLDSEDARNILRKLGAGTIINDIDEVRSNNKDSIDFIFVAAEGKEASILYSNVITALETTGDSIPIIGSHNWLADDIVTESKFANMDIKLFARNLINTTDSSYRIFEQKYIHRFGKSPSNYAATGFNLMLSFGKLLKEHGTYFQLAYQKEDFIISSPISGGFNYRNSNNNTFVPLIQWNGSEIEIIYQKKIIHEEDE